MFGLCPNIGSTFMKISGSISVRRGKLALSLFSYLLLAGMVLFTPAAVQGGSFKVGSFTKTTVGAPASQTVAHGLGVIPKAIIFWTESRTATMFGTSRHTSIGFTDGTANERSASAASQDNAGFSNASRRIADKAITIVQWGETVLAEANRTAWDATNFTLNWTTNDANAYVIHFIAIGGTEISAKVVDWTMPVATGNFSVTGIGFTPVVVIHAHAGSGFTSAIPGSQTHGAMDLGVMDAGGAQWAKATLTVDNVTTELV